MSKILLGSHTNRRSFLVGSSAAFAFGATSWPRYSQAATGEIVVANWGGDWNDRTVKFFEAPIVEKAGYSILHDLAPTADQRRTKLLAERRLPRGTLDVIHLDDVDASFMNTQGVLQALDDNNVPRLANVHSQLKLPYFIPWQFSGWTIAYNPEKVPEPPKSFADLWNPKYAGMIGLTEPHWFHHMEMAGLVNGGSMTDIEKMKSALLDLKKAVAPKIYPQHLQQAQALQNGEIAIITNYKSRVLQFAKEGVKLEPVYPSEGAIAITYGAVVSNKAPNMEGALFYVNALLDAQGMSGLVQESFYSPAVNDAPLTDSLRTKIEFTEQERSKLHFRDHAFWTENLGSLLQWWNQEFKA